MKFFSRAVFIPRARFIPSFYTDKFYVSDYDRVSRNFKEIFTKYQDNELKG